MLESRFSSGYAGLGCLKSTFEEWKRIGSNIVTNDGSVRREWVRMIDSGLEALAQSKRRIDEFLQGKRELAAFLLKLEEVQRDFKCKMDTTTRSLRDQTPLLKKALENDGKAVEKNETIQDSLRQAIRVIREHTEIVVQISASDPQANAHQRDESGNA
ncbi:MAG: hypothetical protein Q9157_002354 [Trypethelium eluteriae]